MQIKAFLVASIWLPLAHSTSMGIDADQKEKTQTSIIPGLIKRENDPVWERIITHINESGIKEARELYDWLIAKDIYDVWELEFYSLQLIRNDTSLHKLQNLFSLVLKVGLSIDETKDFLKKLFRIGGKKNLDQVLDQTHSFFVKLLEKNIQIIRGGPQWMVRNHPLLFSKWTLAMGFSIDEVADMFKILMDVDLFNAIHGLEVSIKNQLNIDESLNFLKSSSLFGNDGYKWLGMVNFKNQVTFDDALEFMNVSTAKNVYTYDAVKFLKYLINRRFTAKSALQQFIRISTEVKSLSARIYERIVTLPDDANTEKTAVENESSFQRIEEMIDYVSNGSIILGSTKSDAQTLYKFLSRNGVSKDEILEIFEYSLRTGTHQWPILDFFISCSRIDCSEIYEPDIGFHQFSEPGINIHAFKKFFLKLAETGKGIEIDINVVGRFLKMALETGSTLDDAVDLYATISKKEPSHYEAVIFDSTKFLLKALKLGIVNGIPGKFLTQTLKHDLLLDDAQRILMNSREWITSINWFNENAASDAIKQIHNNTS